MRESLLEIYDKLYRFFGPQGWWPADSDFEVVVGAILTQSTSWTNVEKAIANLKKAGRLSFSGMAALRQKELARLIRPAGYYNIKARRLQNFLAFLEKNYRGSLKRMRRKPLSTLRPELLSVNGIGPETADSILLYALQKPVFVVDAYTRRILGRHGLLDEPCDYHSIQEFLMGRLRHNSALFNEYHALLVKCAKEFCKKQKIDCHGCPLDEKK